MNNSFLMRVAIIAGCLFIIASFTIWQIFSVVNKAKDPVQIRTQKESLNLSNPEEGNTFVNLEKEYYKSHTAPAIGKVRTLDTALARRAFPGAPPMIPHDVPESMESEFFSCLTCHENGGFNPTLNAYAPITPHPEYLNCRQCHVPQVTKTLFKKTNWKSEWKPIRDIRDLEEGPLRIPHTLQLRENCASCHVGPGAAAEIRTTHPERINCRQCHVPVVGEGVFGK